MTGTIRTRKTLLPSGDWGEVPEYLIDGKPVTKEAFDAAFPEQEGWPGMTHGAGWPMASDGMAVHPDQIPEARERDLKHGITTDYLPDGRPVLRDRAHRRAMMRSLGLIDRNSYTGY